ncbi:MAG: hypothetical protein ACRDJN_12800 [Chloroflexota bacterium]
MALLTSADYPAVRSAIDVDLTAEQVPDTILAQPVYHAAAEAAVLRRVPEAEALTGTQLQQASRAAILFCAALLAPAVPALSQESFADVSYRLAAVDMSRQAARLLARAEEELEALAAEVGLTGALPVPYAGGISVADKQQRRHDPDRVKPAFGRDLFTPSWPGSA